MKKRLLDLLTNTSLFSYLPGRISFWIATFFISIISITNLIAQPTKEWDRTIGGNDYDNIEAIHQTADGGYIMGGTSYSGSGGDKTENSVGQPDYWVVKLNAAGVKEWDKTLGGNYLEYFESIQQTDDGGYIVGGASGSDASGDKSKANRGAVDFWVVKLNATGNIEWESTLGGTGSDYLYSVRQTADGGFILGGFSDSDASGEKTENGKGSNDYWIVKLDAAGVKEWDKTLGASNGEFLYSVEQTTDEGYILGGWSTSDASGDKSENAKGVSDFWVVKLDAARNIVWEKTIGGNDLEWLNYLEQTADGGYVMGGPSASDAGGDKTENSRGGFTDYWVVKLAADGTKEWDKTIGGSGYDILLALKQAPDGSYILGGSSDSDAGGDKTENAKGAWLVKLSSTGNKLWDKTFSGGASIMALDATHDGGYILGITSQANAGGEKSENSKGLVDYWVIKLRGISPPPPPGSCNLALTTKVIQAEAWYGLNGPFIGAGAIDLTATGGTAPYTYRWNAGVSSQDLGLASPGYYNVTVTDANGCKAMTSVYVGRKNSPMTLSTSYINSSRPNGQEGAIDLSVIGGVGPYRYSWSNGATIEDLTGLPAGQYIVTVTDNAGKTATTSVTLSEPSLEITLVASHQNVSIGGADDGFIDLTVIGGVGPYTYRWNAGPSTQDLTRVTAGQYFVTVTDANGTRAGLTVWVGTGGMAAIGSVKNPGNTGELIIKETGLTAYPNPATDRATINLSLAAPGHYALELYDIRGAKVKTLASGQAIISKELTVELDITNYAEGIYMLKLVNGKSVLTKRLIVKR
jgi:hypothetical protein